MQKIVENLDVKEIDNDNVKIVYNNVDEIPELSILLSAVDFHCVPSILTNINDKYTQYSESDIKKAGECSSSKRFGCKKKNLIWDDIRKDVKKFQKWYIKKLNFDIY